MKVKIEDTVKIIAGKDKEKTGKIMRIIRNKNKVVVEKVNMRTKHIKKTAEKRGEKIHFEAPIHVSNVMVICPNCGKPTRAGYKKLESGKKERICKRCKETLDKNLKTKK